MTKAWKHYINGQWQDAVSGDVLETKDPSNEQVIATLARGTAADVDRAVQAAAGAMLGEWGQTKPKERARLLYDVARLLEKHADEFAELETRDAGKPLQQSKKEVLGTARYFEFYAGAADKIHGETIPLGPDYIDFTIREPMGVTAHIVPWNMPLNMIGRSVAPALACGNTAVVKPSEMTSQTALKMAEIFAKAGLPAGVYNVVTGLGGEAGEPLSTHPDIDCITFTGSVSTGRGVMIAAAKHIKPVVLELGGKSPHIIFADADPDQAAAEAAKGIFANCGQICSAGSRLVIEHSIKDAVLERLVQRIKGMRIGPGMDKPDMGPLVSDVHHERVLGYIDQGRREGATLVCGGTRPDHLDKGYFVAPTVFDQVGMGMTIAQEEIFGPVLAVTSFADEAEALALANGTPYGLVAGIFTHDIDRAMRLARDVRAGQIYINEYFAGGEETPFGGTKQSGFGREKGLAALEHYSQIKNVCIRIRS